MHYLMLFALISLLGFYSTGYGAEISSAQLSRVNGFAIVDNEGERYITAPALNASAHAWHHTDEALEKTILDGSPRAPRMAAWKNSGISTGDAQDLVAYIKSLWTRRELDCQGPKHMQCMQ